MLCQPPYAGIISDQPLRGGTEHRQPLELRELLQGGDGLIAEAIPTALDVGTATVFRTRQRFIE